MQDNTQNIIQAFDTHAQPYADLHIGETLYQSSLDLFCDYLTKPDASILELGCGPGNITQYLLAKRPDIQILGTDLAPSMIELARTHNPSADFQIMDSRDMLSLNRRFDALMCGFILPYLSREETFQLFSDAAAILHPGGILYLSSMEDDYSKSALKGPSDGKGPQIMMYYHEGEVLKSALEERGFNIISLTRQGYPEKDGSVTTDLIILAKQIPANRR
jgi:cyclopropane fatty-acyl-phospholipid synthase-like methyltransferase